MLSRLHIQNYAIIENLNLDLQDGLTIITGETGAGKSILLGALGLIMGKRADSKVLFDQTQKCFVEAEFNITSYKLQPFFEQYDLDYDDQLIIRREISSAGKSRAFVNDTPAKLDALQKLSAALLDMHQQFDTLGLQEKSFQIKLLDAIASNQQHIELYQKQFKKYQEDLRKLEDLKEQQKSSRQEFDFIQFQLREFDEADLNASEDIQLQQNLSLMENAEQIKALAQKFEFTILSSDQAIGDQLQELAQELSSFESQDESIQSMYQRLLSTREELLEISHEFERFGQRIDFDPNEIDRLRSRQDLINRLLHKHRVSDIQDLIKIKEDLSNRSTSVSDLDATIEKLEKEIGANKAELMSKAKKISDKRKKASGPFQKEVHALLSQLSMASAQLKIEISEREQLNINGIDEVEFTFSSNIGSEFLSIKKVASGGEMSRLSLCIKSIVADSMSLPTMIFDEIDTGISGDVSLKMGRILKEISKDHQVLSITHSPPIAAQADHHYRIYKEHSKERSFTYVEAINGKERIHEIAKMMSGGDPPTKKALDNAKELIA